MIEFKLKGRLLSAESRPYDIEGNSGVSHKVRFLVGDAILPLKTDEQTVKRLEAQLGSDGEITIELRSRKENVALWLSAFVSTK